MCLRRATLEHVSHCWRDAFCIKESNASNATNATKATRANAKSKATKTKEPSNTCRSVVDRVLTRFSASSLRAFRQLATLGAPEPEANPEPKPKPESEPELEPEAMLEPGQARMEDLLHALEHPSPVLCYRATGLLRHALQCIEAREVFRSVEDEAVMQHIVLRLDQAKVALPPSVVRRLAKTVSHTAGLEVPYLWRIAT